MVLAASPSELGTNFTGTHPLCSDASKAARALSLLPPRFCTKRGTTAQNSTAVHTRLHNSGQKSVFPWPVVATRHKEGVLAGNNPVECLVGLILAQGRGI